MTISIHAPLAGCDDFLKNVFTGNWISIHAPLAGCDVTMPLTVPKHLHFNPRTPCGVRRHCRPRALCGRRISIHAPLAGCDAALRDKASEFFISIHAPLAGCDDRVYSYIRQENEFQSTHPLRGATLTFSQDRRKLSHFNPRTPCGVRLLMARIRGLKPEFQSTHPLRGATFDCNIIRIKCIISIHAPLAGCDEQGPRGATGPQDFNPRTPCGVRQ